MTGFKYEWESTVSILKAPFDVTVVQIFEGLGRIQTFCALLKCNIKLYLSKIWCHEETSSM